MKIKQVYSPNFDDVEITVEFVVIHYTAMNVKSTLAHFKSPHSKVSSHFVISSEGVAYEVVPALKSPAKCAWHAGKSKLKIGKKIWENFNAFSIGIELENLNGNLLPYGAKQYQTLVKILKALVKKYPALNNPQRIIGHEQIAGFRGKADPGYLFNWDKVYRAVFPGRRYPNRKAVVTAAQQRALSKLLGITSKKYKSHPQFWPKLNQALENAKAES